MSADPGEGRLPQAIEDAVLAILEGDDGERGTALRALIAQHPQHAPAIRNWLAGAGVTVPGTAPPATEGAAAAADPNDTALPQRLGAYVLHAVLGRGGFGTVYRAEQLEPIHRPVAVKVLNPGMDSREVLARFSAEREALNRMDHPGIARLLDAGTTPKGRPFFVMELVEGPTLANHCRQQKLPLRARLELFLLVLDAMQHAHQKAVLHRDLSSNNVLVADPNGRPQPKIIDFGIAKSLRDPLLQGGAMTFQGTLMGTPEFMSPEQAAGRTDDIDTRADVYALGVQLYELLTDRLPIPGVVLRAQGLAGMADVIANHAVVPPSEAAPKDRRQQLRGDLDSIVGKALGKARDERYASVGEFAADLRRHLADEPVQVVSPTTWYRLRKFVRRHKAQSAAASAAALVMLGLLGGLLWALRTERAARAEVQMQKDALTAKADAGFRLLANEERLAAAIAAEAALPPPWPEHEAAHAGWLARHGEPLASEIGKLEERLAALAARKAASPRGAFEDPADQHLENALVRLRAELLAFAGGSGPLERVRERLSFLREVAKPAAAAHEAAWQAAADAIQRSDGESASAAYRGVRLPRLSGLVPLGANPATRLFEFLDLRSHAREAPLPVRDAGGALRCGADTGIVFVLLPGGTVRLGARRGDPGMTQNDEEAEDDELRGELATLDEFLLARTELTAGQWARLSGQPLEDRDPLLPAAGIDWHEAVATLGRADLMLPTEAQWEFACRASTTTPWCTGANPLAVSSHGWFGPRPQRVGLLHPNAYGLHDMHGNVAEWCRDEKVAYGTSPPRVGDGQRAAPAPGSGAPRVVRGGACHQGPIAARSSARAGTAPGIRDSAIGLRPVRRLRAGP
jgi:serine/threonine protein kinase/formylglycine-generating enzyme required for sulfatase activity